MIIVSKRTIKFFQWFLRNEGACAMALFPFIILDDEKYRNDKYMINHEKIHLRQQLELLILPFYIWYLIEYYKKGYMSVSFEREAYANEYDLNYLKKRKSFSFYDYL